MKQITNNKRYQFLKKLGEGGMGEVYKVRDLTNDKIIALKLLSKKAGSSETVRRFQREFKLLAELRHPNLCQTYDFGALKDGRCYFTMEYVDGDDIFLTTKGLAQQNIFPLIVQVCRALEYIHSKGLIHCDIKPGNILICRSDNEPQAKLMDFGLAGGQRFSNDVYIRGTIPYIAPEVLKGLEIDRRTDLFSLGVLLYELFTGRLFKIEQGAKSLVSIFQDHLSLTNDFPARIKSDIPDELQELMIRLTALEPAERFARANEVILEINRLTKNEFALETRETIESYLLSSRFVGREKEFEILKDSYWKRMKSVDGKIQNDISRHPTSSTSPSLILISGEPGIGKSRLLREFKAFVQFQRGRALTGCARPGMNVSYRIYYDIFKELIGYIAATPDIKTSLAVVSRIFPGILDGRFKRPLPELVPLEPKQEKLRTYEALTELVKRGCEKLGDTVIFLEDLHWADSSDLEFLEYLSRNLSGANILICATCRSGEENSTLKKMLENVKDEDYFYRIELKPLDECALSSFLDSTITGSSNSQELVQFLAIKTNGNPFFVEEMMRTLLTEGRITIGDRIDPEIFKKISFPERIEEVLLRRLSGLDKNLREIVKYAAILRTDFDFELMKKLTTFSDEELTKNIWMLKQKQILIEEKNRYRFYHPILREVVCKQLSGREKRELNYSAGLTLEEINKGNLDKVVEELAFYFINGKNHNRGIKYGLAAAEKCKKKYANEPAIEFYKGALYLLGNNNLKKRFDVLKNLAELEVYVGHYDDAIKSYRHALNLKIGAIDQRARIHQRFGDIYEKKGEYDKALEHYNQTIECAKKTKSKSSKNIIMAQGLAGIGVIFTRKDDLTAAENYDNSALNLLKGSKCSEAKKLYGKIYNSLGNLNVSMCNFPTAVLCHKKSLKISRENNDELGITVNLHNLGNIANRQGDYTRAFHYYQSSLQKCNKIGDIGLFSIIHGNFAAACLNKGDYNMAADYYMKALEISSKIAMATFKAFVLQGLGTSFLRLNCYNKAEEYYKKSARLCEKMGDKAALTYSLVGLGEVALTIGHYTMALKYFKDGLDLRRQMGNQFDICNSLLILSSAAFDLGDLQGAKSYIDEGLKIAASIGMKGQEVDCYRILCCISIIDKDYAAARNYHEKGIMLSLELGKKQSSLFLFIELAEINYFERKYAEGAEAADKAVMLAKEIDTKDLYAEALLIKAKNESKTGLVPKIKIIEFLKEALNIAGEIKKPELLWKVYFEYGRILQKEQQYQEALDYYQKCLKIFMEVTGKIKEERYKESYINRPDRQEVFTAINEIEKVLGS